MTEINKNEKQSEKELRKRKHIIYNLFSTNGEPCQVPGAPSLQNSIRFHDL